MTQIEGENMPPVEALASISYDQLIGDQSAVQDALEWGFDKELPIIEDIWPAVYGEGGDRWVRNGGVILRTVSYGDHSIVIRESEASTEIDTLRETVNRVMRDANDEYYKRLNYDRNISHAKSDHAKEQRRNGIATGVISTLGSFAMGYGFPALNEVVKMVAYQPNPLSLISGAIVGSVVPGVAIAAGTYRKYRKRVTRTENPELAPRGEEVLRQLTPALETLADAYGTDIRPQDILIQDRDYKMDLKEVKKLLKKPGGPEPEDFETVLEDLEETATGSGKQKAKYYVYNPANLVKQMITDTNSEIWSDKFAASARVIASAQVAIGEKQEATEKVKELTDNVVGANDKQHISALKRDIGNLKKTIDIEVLRLLKLRAQYAADKMCFTNTVPIDDPYTGPRAIAAAAILDSQLSSEVQTPDHNNWPLLNKPITEGEEEIA